MSSTLSLRRIRGVCPTALHSRRNKSLPVTEEWERTKGL
jgi:hypothetical protein